MSRFSDIHRQSVENPDDFWGAAADGIDWERRWDKVLDDSNAPIYRWFTGGRLNTCFNALDRHVDAVGVRSTLDLSAWAPRYDRS